MIWHKYIFLILSVQVYCIVLFCFCFLELELERPCSVFHLISKFLGFLYQEKVFMILITHFTAENMFHFEEMSENLTADVYQ